MQRFRIKETDTIKATATSSKTRKLLCSMYDSGFTTIEGVQTALLKKIPFFGGKSIDISITNLDKEQYKNLTIRVN